jgi:hypothetical protein
MRGSVFVRLDFARAVGARATLATTRLVAKVAHLLVAVKQTSALKTAGCDARCARCSCHSWLRTIED